MDGIGLIIFGGIGLLVAGGIAISSWSAKKRKEAWQQVAEELGLPFVDTHNDVLGKCAAMKIFNTGSGRRFYNALEGDAGDTTVGPDGAVEPGSRYRPVVARRLDRVDRGGDRTVQGTGEPAHDRHPLGGFDHVPRRAHRLATARSGARSSRARRHRR